MIRPFIRGVLNNLSIALMQSEQDASRDVERAAGWARLAMEIAVRVRGPEAWCRRVEGYAAGFGAKVARLAGRLKTAEDEFGDANRLWISGLDPLGVLDPGRMLALERSLRLDGRRSSNRQQG